MSLNPWTVLQTAQLFIQQQQSGGMNSSGLMADLNEIYQQQMHWEHQWMKEREKWIERGWKRYHEAKAAGLDENVLKSIQAKLQKELYEFDMRLLNQRPTPATTEPTRPSDPISTRNQQSNNSTAHLDALPGLQVLIRQQQAQCMRRGVPGFQQQQQPHAIQSHSDRKQDDYGQVIKNQRRVLKLWCWMNGDWAVDSPEIQ